jgi:D-glycero-D-manno-heptose 1,7-bisphosphate phosphatase
MPAPAAKRPPPRLSQGGVEVQQYRFDARSRNHRMAIDEAGLWCEIASADCRSRAALFLDRDGVIIEDRGYVGRIEDMRLIADAAPAIARCNALGIPVVVVTNQSGIARGYYRWSDFHAVQAALSAALSTAGARIDAVLACAYHEAGSEPLRVANHPWRKPNPGMLVAAAGRMNLDLAQSWIVGDKASDLAAGAAAGIAGGTLIAGDDRERQEASRLANPRYAVATAASLAAAVATLTESGHFARQRFP